MRGEELLAEKRTGKQVVVETPGARAVACLPLSGDAVAVMGNNGKLLLFPLAEVPEMARGRGGPLQAYGSGGLAAVRTITLAEGLRRRVRGGERQETDLHPWRGHRGRRGRLAPPGFLLP